MNARIPPIRYFLYVLATVDATIVGIFMAWSLVAATPGVEVIAPVLVVSSVVGIVVVVKEFSRPA